MTRQRILDLILVLTLALIGRVLLLASGSVSFHSDEATVALQARHILQGARPVFFYGQAYMGSVDAFLVAGGFSIFGQNVLAIRLVQSAMYLLIVATSYFVGWRLSGQRVVALTGALVMAVPPVVGALYTTATLGGYNETLLLGNLLLLLGYDVSHEHSKSLWRWALLGFFAGIGWWANGLIIAYGLPVALMILWVWVRRIEDRVFYAGMIGVALVAFSLGGLPWWWYNFTHDNAALAALLPFWDTPAEFAGIGVDQVTLTDKLLALVLFGIPTVFGMRHPWNPMYFLIPVGLVVIVLYLFSLLRMARSQETPLKRDARPLLLGMILLFLLIFLGTSFGADPTGRYFLPLLLPLAIILGTFFAALPDRVQPHWRVMLAVVLAYNAAGQFDAVTTVPPGMTTQFDSVTHIPNTHDEALIAFLEENGLTHGYTNYWVAMRTAFLSGELIQYSAELPYKPDLSYNPADKRYKPFVEATEAADRIAYITTNNLALDEFLVDAFAERGVTYETTQIGSFNIYHDFEPETPRIRFSELEQPVG